MTIGFIILISFAVWAILASLRLPAAVWKPPHCAQCGYELDSLDGRCPECGIFMRLGGVMTPALALAGQRPMVGLIFGWLLMWVTLAFAWQLLAEAGLPGAQPRVIRTVSADGRVSVSRVSVSQDQTRYFFGTWYSMKADSSDPGGFGRIRLQLISPAAGFSVPAPPALGASPDSRFPFIESAYPERRTVLKTPGSARQHFDRIDAEALRALADSAGVAIDETDIQAVLTTIDVIRSDPDQAATLVRGSINHPEVVVGGNAQNVSIDTQLGDTSIPWAKKYQIAVNVVFFLLCAAGVMMCLRWRRRRVKAAMDLAADHLRKRMGVALGADHQPDAPDA